MSECRTGKCPNVGQSYNTEISTEKNKEHAESKKNARAPDLKKKKESSCGDKCKNPDYWVDRFYDLYKTHTQRSLTINEDKRDEEIALAAELHKKYTEREINNSGCRTLSDLIQFYWNNYPDRGVKAGLEKFIYKHFTFTFFANESIQEALLQRMKIPKSGWLINTHFHRECSICGVLMKKWVEKETRNERIMCPECEGTPYERKINRAKFDHLHDLEYNL